jgi:hypothetical protein
LTPVEPLFLLAPGPREDRLARPHWGNERPPRRVVSP